MTRAQVAAWVRSGPGMLVAVLTIIAILAAVSGDVLDMFRTPARVDAVEVEVRGHHDTLGVVFERTITVDSLHNESHAIQEQLRDIGYIICDLAEIPATECKVGG